MYGRHPFLEGKAKRLGARGKDQLNLHCFAHPVKPLAVLTAPEELHEGECVAANATSTNHPGIVWMVEGSRTPQVLKDRRQGFLAVRRALVCRGPERDRSAAAQGRTENERERQATPGNAS
jgi:hypothetical protein